MKKTLFLLILAILIILCLIKPAGASYGIDGNLTDWGIDLTQAVSSGYLDTNKPSGGLDIDVVTEDNADKNSPINTLVGPGYTHTGNTYDAEAIYFDNDATYAYVAVITGLSRTGNTYPPGDIFFEIGASSNPFSSSYAPSTKAFAIAVNSGTLYDVASIDPVDYPQHGIANPWRIGTDNNGVITPDNLALLDLGLDFVYSTDPLNTSHYVMEARIPLTTLGLDLTGGGDSDLWIHWTMKCGNDYLNLRGDVNSTPEPATLLLLGSGIFGMIGFRKNKK